MPSYVLGYYAILQINPTSPYEPLPVKIYKMSVRPAKTKISLGIRAVGSVFSVHSFGS